MFKTNYLRNFFCILAVLAPSASGFAAEATDKGQFLDSIVAIVNEGVVLQSQVDEQEATVQKRAEEQQLALPPDTVLHQQILDRLILNEIELQRADRIGLQVSDQMLNEAVAQIAKQNGVAFEKMPALLAKDGVTYADFRRNLKDEITLDQLRRIDVGQRIKVSDREINQCIADLADNVLVKSEYNLSHIMLAIPETANTDDVRAIRDKARDIYKKIKDGADFREMAIQYSASQDALEGGALGWMKGDQLPTMFISAVSKMQSGDVSEPFRSANSFHIVKVNDLRVNDQHSEVNQVKVRHILVTPNEIKDSQTAKQQVEDARKRILAGEDFAEVAKLVSDDPGSATEGGDLGWTNPGTFVPEFDKVIAETKVGEISEPFQTPFGWHIVQVLDRRVYDNTDDLKKRNCDQRIRNSKMGEETELWTRRLRDEAYVDVLKK